MWGSRFFCLLPSLRPSLSLHSPVAKISLSVKVLYPSYAFMSRSTFGKGVKIALGKINGAIIQ
ncbi:hypothetical protein NC651_024595 [Populus alba x Populus x berolinensis]|nr:hypothetical protein NC651_024595 [Populus alba x Populus x berolinensis]